MAERPAVRAAASALAVVALAHAAALAAPPGAAWGLDAARFLGDTALACALLAAVTLPLALDRLPAPGGRAGRTALGVALLAVALAFAWRFRVAHVLLGDGIPITTMLPEQHAPHPREPLAS